MRDVRLVKVVEQQNAIISIQAGVIDELFRLLAQYIAMEELEKLSVIDKINAAARIHADMDRELYGDGR